MGRLDGKVALITGAARGQGRSHAVTFAREGAAVAICDIAEPIPGLFYPLGTEAELEETRRLVEQEGARALAMKVDARSSSELDAFVAAAVSELGRVDVLCANAGIIDLGSWDMTEEQWDLMLDVNLKSVWLTCRAVIPTMIEQGSGAIVCTASLSGLRPFGNAMQYGIAKHGVVGLVRHLAVDLGPHNIRVNAVCPGALNSPMLMNQPMWEKMGGPGTTAEEAGNLIRAQHLLDVPWLESEDVSNAILWLVSDEGRYVTGTAVEIEAGALRVPPGATVQPH